MQQTHFISSSSTAHINFRHYVCSTITTPFRHCCYYCSKRFIHVDLFILRHNFLFPFQFLPFPHSVPAASYSIPLQTNFVLLEANWTLFYIYIFDWWFFGLHIKYSYVLYEYKIGLNSFGVWWLADGKPNRPKTNMSLFVI